jgi:uncharacterized protein
MSASFTSRSNWIARNPIKSFIILAFLIAYFIGIPFNMFVSSFLQGANEVIWGLFPRVMTVYAPALSAIMVTYFISGWQSSKTLLEKLKPNPKHLLWWFMIPIVCTSITFTSFALGGVSTTQLEDFCRTNLHLLLLHFVFQFIIVGVGEELGWRGWLLPKFTQQTSVGTATLIVTTVWGVWHVPIFFSGIQVVIPWLMILFSVGFIVTWIWYKVKGNVFVLAIAHASMNAPEVFLENRLKDVTANNELFLAGWEILGYAYLFLAGIIVASNYGLWRKKIGHETPFAN